MKQNLLHEESLNIIQEMIVQARGNLSKGEGKHFLLWGYIIAFSSLAHFCIASFLPQFATHIGYIWLTTTVLGFITSFIWGYRDRQKELVRTFMSDINGKVWIGFAIGVFLIYFFPIFKNLWYIYPSISVLYIYALFLSASIYKFKWMLLSVAIGFVCVILYKFVPYIYYPLLMAIIMLVGNIIPGHIISHKAKRNNHV